MNGNRSRDGDTPWAVVGDTHLTSALFRCGYVDGAGVVWLDDGSLCLAKVPAGAAIDRMCDLWLALEGMDVGREVLPEPAPDEVSEGEPLTLHQAWLVLLVGVAMLSGVAGWILHGVVLH